MTGRGRGLDMTTPDIRTEREMLPAAAPDAAKSREFWVTASLIGTWRGNCRTAPTEIVD